MIATDMDIWMGSEKEGARSVEQGEEVGSKKRLSLYQIWYRRKFRFVVHVIPRSGPTSSGRPSVVGNAERSSAVTDEESTPVIKIPGDSKQLE